MQVETPAQSTTGGILRGDTTGVTPYSNDESSVDVVVGTRRNIRLTLGKNTSRTMYMELGSELRRMVGDIAQQESPTVDRNGDMRFLDDFVMDFPNVGLPNGVITDVEISVALRRNVSELGVSEHDPKYCPPGQIEEMCTTMRMTFRVGRDRWRIHFGQAESDFEFIYNITNPLTPGVHIRRTFGAGETAYAENPDVPWIVWPEPWPNTVQTFEEEEEDRLGLVVGHLTYDGSKNSEHAVRYVGAFGISWGQLIVNPLGDGTEPPAPGITVAPTAGLVTTEPGGTDSFTVVLDTQPTAPVSIDVSTSDAGEGLVSSGAQGPAASITLNFDGTNWDQAQTVTLTGQDDATLDGDIAYVVTTAPAVSTDGDYNGLNAADVSATNIDDDGVTVTIDWITPTQIDAGDTNVPFMVSGSGFQVGATISFEGGNGPAPQVGTVVVTPDFQILTTISVSDKGPKGPRVWDVRVTNPDSTTDVLGEALTVLKSN